MSGSSELTTGAKSVAMSRNVFAVAALTFRNSDRRRCSTSRYGISNRAETAVASSASDPSMIAIILVAITPICRAASAASVYLPDRAASSSVSSANSAP